VTDVLAVPRRTVPITPLVYAVQFIPAVFIALLAVGGGIADRTGVPLVIVAFVGSGFAAAVTAAIGWWSWARLTYYIDADGDLRVDSGILQRLVRRLQLSRLQSVDVVAPLAARLFGLVELRVEVAGIGDSRATLRYLNRGDAQELRAHILDRAALLRGEAPPVGEGPEPGDEAPTPSSSEVLAQVPSGRLMGGLLLRSSTAGLLLLTAVVIAGTVFTQGPAGLVVALITGGVPIFSVLTEFLTFAGFVVTRGSRGLRVRHGLLQVNSRTIPTGRVQGVQLVAPLLWRRYGWVRVELTIAGLGGEAGDAGRAVLLPVGSRQTALDLIAEVLPEVDLDSLPWQSVPSRVRRRAPIQWRVLAYAVTDAVIASRRGRITRRIAVAPHARVQSVRVTQGPWERSLALASVHVDLAPGPVQVIASHIDLAQARPLADAEADRARRARLGST
jgi:putative membrane protein